MLLRIFILMLLVITSVSASEIEYGKIKIPVMDGASNVKNNPIGEYYQFSTEYNIRVRDTNKVHAFYEKFFSSLGWGNKFGNFPNKKTDGAKGNWSSYAARHNEKGSPEAIHGSRWDSKEIPAFGQAVLTVTEYKNKEYYGKVKVTISPVIDMSPIIKFNNIIFSDTKVFFILTEAVGGVNPFEVSKVNEKPLSKYKDISFVKEYYESIGTIKKNLQEFGKKYVNR